jgi:hypothetical protein
VDAIKSMKKLPELDERVVIVGRRKSTLKRIRAKAPEGSKQKMRAEALLKFCQTRSFSEAAKHSKLSKNTVRKYVNRIVKFDQNGSALGQFASLAALLAHDGRSGVARRTRRGEPSPLVEHVAEQLKSYEQAGRYKRHGAEDWRYSPSVEHIVEGFFRAPHCNDPALEEVDACTVEKAVEELGYRCLASPEDVATLYEAKKARTEPSRAYVRHWWRRRSDLDAALERARKTLENASSRTAPDDASSEDARTPSTEESSQPEGGADS